MFGKRGTFEPGQLQQEPQEATFQRGPDLDNYLRSGTGRCGSRGGVGKHWGKARWALEAHDIATKDPVQAKRLFLQQFPEDKKADVDVLVTCQHDIDQWIQHFMNRAQWESGKSSRAFSGKPSACKNGKFQAASKGSGSASSSGAASSSLMPPPPPPARR